MAFSAHNGMPTSEFTSFTQRYIDNGPAYTYTHLKRNLLACNRILVTAAEILKVATLSV